MFGYTCTAHIGYVDVEADINAGDHPAGIICGYDDVGTRLDRCVTRGVVQSNIAAGGICGIGNGSRIIDCINMASVNSLSGYAGGIVGSIEYNIYIKYCLNRGSVTTVDGYCGGIVGYWANKFKSTTNKIENCVNAGVITTITPPHSGYILGAGQGPLAINNCYTTSQDNTNDWATDVTVTLSGSDFITFDEIRNGKALAVFDDAFGQQIGVDAYPEINDESRIGEDNYLYKDYYDTIFKCGNFKLTDQLPLYLPINAGNVSYTREANNKTWGTLCLPFAFTADDAARYYKDARIEGQNVVLTAVETGEEIPAGTPLITETTDGSMTFSEESKSLVATAVTSDGDMTFHGSFVNQTLDATTAEDDIYYISGDKLMHATGTLNVKPYRAYFTMPKAAAGAKSYNLVVDDEATGIKNLELGTESLEDVLNDSEIYSTDGVRRNHLERGINIIRKKDGKTTKVIVK